MKEFEKAIEYYDHAATPIEKHYFKVGWMRALGWPLNGCYYISIKDKDGQFVHHKVTKEVYYYIKQLEACIKFPKLSKLKEFYPERFSK